jgi:hypothetical protein
MFVYYYIYLPGNAFYVAAIILVFLPQVKNSECLKLRTTLTRWSWDSVVDTSTGYGLDGRGVGVRVLFTSSKLALGSTQPPIQWLSGLFPRGLKRTGREADHSPPTSAEVKNNVDLYIHSPTRLHGVVLTFHHIHKARSKAE